MLFKFHVALYPPNVEDEDELADKVDVMGALSDPPNVPNVRLVPVPPPYAVPPCPAPIGNLPLISGKPKVPALQLLTVVHVSPMAA